MAQTYETLVSGTTTFGQLYGKINNIAEALRSSFSGTSFPVSPPPVEGQLCFRTDLDKLYIYSNGAWERLEDEIIGNPENCATLNGLVGNASGLALIGDALVAHVLNHPPARP